MTDSSNRPFLFCLLTTPPPLKYPATLPCNLSFIACFLTLLLHRATYARCGGIYNNHFTVNLLHNFPVKTNENRLRLDQSAATFSWTTVLQTTDSIINAVKRQKFHVYLSIVLQLRGFRSQSPPPYAHRTSRPWLRHCRPLRW